MCTLDITGFSSENAILEAIERHENIHHFHTTLFFPSQYQYSRYIRSFVAAVFKKNNIARKWQSRFILICDEIINNSIEYGSKSDEKNTFLFSFARTQSDIQINIEVSDKGNGSSPKTRTQMEQLRETKRRNSRNLFATRGRGLFQIVEQLMDDLYFEDNTSGGLTVGVTKIFPKKDFEDILEKN